MAELIAFLKKLNPWWFGFFLSALFVTLVMTAIVTENITADVRKNFGDNLADKCSLSEELGGAGFVGVQLERCILKSHEGSKLTTITVADCGGCGKNKYGESQLCLVGEDKLFCEENIGKNVFLIKSGVFLDSWTKPITALSWTVMGIIIVILFVVGFGFKSITKK